MEIHPTNSTGVEYNAEIITISPPTDTTFVACSDSLTNCPVQVALNGGAFECVPLSSVEVMQDLINVELFPSVDDESETTTSTTTAVVKISQSAFCLSDDTEVPTSPVTYYTFRPPPPSPTNNGNTTEVPTQIPVYGIGVYVTGEFEIYCDGSFNPP
jgi:hypothetical protein